MKRPDSLEDVVLVTHMGCMDGSGCAIMFIRAGGKRENIRYCAAGMVERFVKEDLPALAGKFLIFADIGLSGPHQMRYADELEKRGDVHLIDHHSTTVPLAGRSWCDVRMEACGTELFRQYLGLEDESSKALAALIQDHDLWLGQNPKSMDLAAFTVFAGQDVFVDRFITRDVRDGVFDELETELMKIVCRRRDQFIAATLKKTLIKDVKYGDRVAKVGYVVSSEMNVSLLLDTMLRQHPEIDAACQINFDKNSVSFRSMNGFDVAELAKYYGGGGHKAAAGHRLSDQLVKELVEEIHG